MQAVLVLSYNLGKIKHLYEWLALAAKSVFSYGKNCAYKLDGNISANKSKL